MSETPENEDPSYLDAMKTLESKNDHLQGHLGTGDIQEIMANRITDMVVSATNIGAAGDELEGTLSNASLTDSLANGLEDEGSEGSHVETDALHSINIDFSSQTDQGSTGVV